MKRSVSFLILPEGATTTVSGRDAWLLRRLVQAGDRGLTGMDLPPGVRTSHYVFKLRKAGLHIESVDERHGGPFAGRHSRYILRSVLTFIRDDFSDVKGIAA